VVDDAIVMIETSAHIEAGDPPLQAALKGAEQIRLHDRVLTVSLIAVLIRCCSWRRGGRLFREFAVTLGITTSSAVVSLTLTP